MSAPEIIQPNNQADSPSTLPPSPIERLRNQGVPNPLNWHPNGTLANPRWERYAQLLVMYRSEGLRATVEGEEPPALGPMRLRAYREAGFGKRGGVRGTSDVHNARRLANDPDIKHRVGQIMLQEAEAIGLSAGAVLLEIARLAHANVYELLSIDEKDGKARPVFDHTRPISKDLAAAVAELGFDSKGRPKIRMHDKAAALRDLAKIFGLYSDSSDVAVQVNNIGLGDRLDAAMRRIGQAA
jgi:hypothetical protein